MFKPFAETMFKELHEDVVLVSHRQFQSAEICMRQQQVVQASPAAWYRSQQLRLAVQVLALPASFSR